MEAGWKSSAPAGAGQRSTERHAKLLTRGHGPGEGCKARMCTPPRGLHRLSAIVAFLACALVESVGCGSDEAQGAKSNREQIRDVVVGFYRDIVDGDIEAACAKLTGAGRAQAVGRGRTIGRPPEPVSEARCRERHLGIRDSTELPSIIENDLLRVRRVTITGDHAQAFTTAGHYDGVQRLRRTDEGWKLDLFDPMVRH
jgi:hypothetical protein